MHSKTLRYLLLFLTITTLSNAFGQGHDSITIVKFGYKIRYAIVDKATQSAKILKYDICRDLTDSLTLVGCQDKFGYIDKSGKEIIPLIYDYGLDFKDGFAVIGIDKITESKSAIVTQMQYGIIDQEGKIIVPVEYDYIEQFSEGLALLRKSFWDDYSFIDKTGKTIISGYKKASSFSEGLACVAKPIDNPLYKEPKKPNLKSNSQQSTDDLYDRETAPLHEIKYLIRYGFIDKENNIIVPFEYEHAADFSDGRAYVKLNGKCGFIDKTGKEVIPLEYDGVGRFEKGLAIVKNNDKLGMIDKNGQIIVPIEYWNAEPFSENLIIATSSHGYQGLFDRKGNQILAPNYHINSPSEGIALIQSVRSLKFGFISKNGEIISEPIYMKAADFKEGMALAVLERNDDDDDDDRYGPKYGFINHKGERVINDIEDIAESFSEGLAKIGISRSGFLGHAKYGFINQKGEVVIDPVFSGAGNFSEGLAIVRDKDENCGYIDKEGTMVIPMKYKDSRDFESGFALAYNLDGNRILLDKEGIEYTIEFIKPEEPVMDSDSTKTRIYIMNGN